MIIVDTVTGMGTRRWDVSDRVMLFSYVIDSKLSKHNFRLGINVQSYDPASLVAYCLFFAQYYVDGMIIKYLCLCNIHCMCYQVILVLANPAFCSNTLMERLTESSYLLLALIFERSMWYFFI